MAKNEEFLDSLDHQLASYEDELAQLVQQRRLLDSKIAQTRDCLERTKALRDAEAKRLGDGTYRFAGMSPIEGCSVVLQEQGRLTKAEIVAALKEGGFIFDSPYPTKVIHVALMRKPYFRKNDDGTYEYVNKQGVDIVKEISQVKPK